jgi:two-component system, NarL family, response regulator NreC
MQLLKQITLLVVGDELIPRAALREMLASHRELRVVGECDTRAAEQEAQKLNPQVIILYIGVPGAAAQGLIQRLHRFGIVVFSRESQEAYVRGCFIAGACAYVLVTAMLADLLAAIRAAAAKKRFLDPLLSDILVEALAHEQPPPTRILSPRELQVLTMLAYGHTNRQIADQLSVSRKSVDTYRQRISSKLNLRTRADIVRYAISMGLMKVGDSDLQSVG